MRARRPAASVAVGVVGASLLRDAGPFKVVSVADGSLRVEPRWSGYRPTDCTWVRDYGAAEWTDCPTCGLPHLGGFVSRMALAARLETLLNRLYREAAKPPGAKRR